MVSKNICKLRHKLKNAKNLPELTWSWQNKPWFTSLNIGSTGLDIFALITNNTYRPAGGGYAWAGKELIDI